MFEDLITSKTRIKILQLFLGNLGEMFHVREIVRRVEEEINAVRRELLLLEKKGILNREARANRVYYSLDTSYPFFYDLIKVYAKESGLGRDIIKNRAKLGRIKFAMLSGDFARNLENNGESVDLLVVGVVVLPELSLIIKKEEEVKKREINYTIMNEDEFNFRKSRRDPFISSIIHGSKVMLIGDEESLVKE
jgi:DNA-binding transcriptional ArsR family regulator